MKANWSMPLYGKLSKIPIIGKNYTYKFLFVAFLGIHVPLIGLLFFIVFGSASVSTSSIVYFTLLFTLLATGCTLVALKRLIKPIEVASKALDDYRTRRLIPSLPLHFKDEAGLLLVNIQESILDNERFLVDKQDLIYLLSHDLRTFAANSQGLAGLIVEENPSETVREYSNLIVESTNQQLAFIATFIKLIHAEDEISRKVLLPKNIVFSSIFDLVAQQLEQKLIAKDVHIKTNFGVIHAYMTIDEDLLVRVLVNLVDNALKFSYTSSQITISVLAEGQKILFEVVDSGIGFDADLTEDLFKKFTNKSRTGTAGEPSTGIGLYLCKKIINKYKGEIVATSAGKNQGATFSVFLNSQTKSEFDSINKN